MKVALTIFLITGFLGIAVFGVFAMNHKTENSHNGCIAMAAQKTDCPKGENVLSFLNFHLDAFRSFSTAIFGKNIANAPFLLIALGLIAFGAIADIVPVSPAPAIISCCQKQFLESYSFPFQREFIRWLALHENSPAVS